MSFIRLDSQDVLISADAVSAPAWSDTTVNLTSFYTSSTQTGLTSGDYYFNIYKDDVNLTSSAVPQFSVAFGHKLGSGSVLFNPAVDGNSPTSVVYKQYRNLINGDEDTDLSFQGTTPEYIGVINVERSRYKEKLLPGSLTLTLTSGSNTIKLTDNSSDVTTTTFTDAGRVYDLISGSAGVKTSTPVDDGQYGYTANDGSYGKFLPDVGLIILNGQALSASANNGGIDANFGLPSNQTGSNNEKLYDFIDTGGSFTLRSEETVTSNYVFLRARNGEVNYSTNPSNITGSGELRHDVMIDQPQAYISAVGLYNDNNDLLAVAKLSRPLLKDFTKEALLRVKLDY